MDLIHNDALLATDAPNQFLGPIFQIIQFKPNVDIVSLLYFRVSSSEYSNHTTSGLQHWSNLIYF